ncbi:MAG: FAD-binding oxidoreductase [Nitrososphaeraceae archaeon]
MINFSIDETLRSIAKGEILSDSWNRKVFSVDASHYTITPKAIVCPIDEIDVSELCIFASKKNISLTPRGAGTGLLGQSLTNDISIDFTKHMNKISEISDDYVVVQPGVSKGLVDKELSKRNKFLPPDPASSQYCTIGGMIANNSSGIHTLGYGSTIDFLEMIEVVYSNGKIDTISGYKNKHEQINLPYSGLNTKIQRLFDHITNASSRKIIINKYPKVSKNSCGYRLDKIIENDNFYPQKIFAASEGTLGLVTKIKLRILDIPSYKSTIVVGFKDILHATSTISKINKFKPIAMELLDGKTILKNNKDFRNSNNKNFGSLLFIEFADYNLSNIETTVRSCCDTLSLSSEIIEVAYDKNSSAKIWQSRRNVLNNVMKLTVGSRKPIGLFEDTVVPVTRLSNLVEFILKEYDFHNLDYVIYGHAGNGNLHTRPMINIDSKNELELITNIAEKIFHKVVNLGGSISGEHSDGIGRLRYIEYVYGKDMLNIFKNIKNIFDPHNILNPGKKILP